MRKISLFNGHYYVDGTKLGIAKRFFDGKIIIKNGKDEIIAIHGSINEKGDFIAFCTKSNCDKCSLVGKGVSCRYNRNLNKNKGYYIE